MVLLRTEHSQPNSKILGFCTQATQLALVLCLQNYTRIPGGLHVTLDVNNSTSASFPRGNFLKGRVLLRCPRLAVPSSHAGGKQRAGNLPA